MRKSENMEIYQHSSKNAIIILTVFFIIILGMFCAEILNGETINIKFIVLVSFACALLYIFLIINNVVKKENQYVGMLTNKISRLEDELKNDETAHLTDELKDKVDGILSKEYVEVKVKYDDDTENIQHKELDILINHVDTIDKMLIKIINDNNYLAILANIEEVYIREERKELVKAGDDFCKFTEEFIKDEKNIYWGKRLFIEVKKLTDLLKGNYKEFNGFSTEIIAHNKTLQELDIEMKELSSKLLETKNRILNI